MSFLSLNFLLFLALLFVLMRIGGTRLNLRNNLLLAASYYFYMCWDWRFAGLLLLNSVVNYYAARRIAAASCPLERKLVLSVALGVGLGLLGYFKYANFFIGSVVSVLQGFGVQADQPLLQLILPLGISFYTFQSLSYTMDVYRGRQQPCRSLRDFALFVAFFPTVLSGPITRAGQLLPQIQRLTPENPRGVESGLILLVRGFVKKIAFADTLAVHIVNPAFLDPSAYSWWFLLLAVYAYSFQIYMDLSGYTDIARGVARLLGFELPRNFNRPYLADSVSNFWQRWHISMSSFFRDYLYFSVGGSKKGVVYVNLLITFLAIGMWHGAGWNFIAYGLVHGSVVGIERWGRNRRLRLGLPPLREAGGWWLLRVFVVFQVVAFSRILFRAESLDKAIAYASAMLSGQGGGVSYSAVALVALLLALALHYVPARRSEASLEMLRRLPAWSQAGGLVAVVYGLMALSSGEAPFAYFQF